MRRYVLLFSAICLWPMITCLPVSAQAMDENDNLVSNPGFEAMKQNGLAEGWQLVGAADFSDDGKARIQGNQSQKVRARTRDIVKLHQVVAVDTATDYFISCWIKSDDRVVMAADGMRMSYTGAGEWQRLSGLVRSGREAKLAIEIKLGGARKRGVMWVDDVRLTRASMPELLPRKLYGKTALVESGRAAAYIIYPAGVEQYRNYAEKIQGAIAHKTGVKLPLVSDVEATESDAPVLKEPYRSSHLILLGRLGINRGIWISYNRFLSAVDGYYPGGEGYVVRTASNVLRNGRNHIIVGSSTEAGAGQAVDRFIQLVGENARSGMLTLPWLLEVKMDGKCLTEYEKYAELWRADPHSVLLPPIGRGYGTVLRWHQNAMSYYWTGWPDFWERAEEAMDLILRDQAMTSHYTLEFLVRVYDMLDDSGKLSRKRITAIDRLLLQNYWDWGHLERARMPDWAPPYDIIQIANRHAISPWMADLVLAGFIHNYFEFPNEGGPTQNPDAEWLGHFDAGRAGVNDLMHVVHFRLVERERFFDDVIMNRWGPSLPGVGGGGHEEEVVHSLFRYALGNERYEFFQSGNAHRAANYLLVKLNHLKGTIVRPGDAYDHRLIFGILASYYGDGRYKGLYKIPQPGRIFMGRYLAGVRRYTPGDEVEAKPFPEAAGVIVPPMMEHNYNNQRRLDDKMFRPSALDAENMLDLAVFRSGLDRTDDYVAFSGVREASLPPQVFLTFNSRGTNWFGSSTSDLYYQQNAVSVQRGDRLISNSGKHYAATARRDWWSNLRTAGAVSSTLSPCMGTQWQRSIVWIRPGLYAVRDVVTALEDGDYLVNVNWRPFLEFQQSGEAWDIMSGGSQMRLTPLGPGFGSRRIREVYRGSRDRSSWFIRQDISKPLRAGEALTSITLLQAERRGSNFYEALWVGPQELKLVSSEGTAMHVYWGPLAGGAVETDAAVAVLHGGGVQLTQATYLRIDSKEVFHSDVPVSASIDCLEGNALFDAAAAARVILATGTGSKVIELEVNAGISSKEIPVWQPDSEWYAAVTAVLRKPVAVQEEASAEELVTQVRDSAKDWEMAWSYHGLQRPVRISGVGNRPGGIVDLGREYDLAEISNRQVTIDQKGPLPAEIWVAIDEEVNGVKQMPEPDSPLWRKVKEAPQWHKGVFVGNYGRGDPLEEGYQVFHLKGVQARYVRGEGLNNRLWFHRGDVRESRGILRAEIVDFAGDGNSNIFLKTDVWPAYRHWREEDNVLAVLGVEGRERFQFEVPTNLQTAQALQWDGSGRKHIILATTDALIRVFEPDGRIIKKIDHYEQQRQFHLKYSKKDMRTPVGGWTVPTSLGLWRGRPDEPAKMALGRYCWFSFIDGRGEFEGVLSDSNYWFPLMLPYGVDFSGDGVEEMLCLGAGAVYHIDGDSMPSDMQWAGCSFPEVYHWTYNIFPQGDRRGTLGGAPNLLFETLPWGNGRRYVLIVSENFLAIYDGRDRRWACSWVPGAPITAAAVTEKSADRLTVLLATSNGLLRQLKWEDDLSSISSFASIVFTDRLARITAVPQESAEAVLSGDKGLYLYHKLNDIELLQKGAFVDGCLLTGENVKGRAVIAVTDKGEVLRLNMKSGR